MPVGSVAVFDFVIDKIKIDQAGDLTERMVGADTFVQTHVHTEQLLLGRVFKTHHEENLQATLE